MLHITGYRKHYDDVTVLHIPSLELGPALYWVRGANGAGKTTLLKSIAGLIPFEGNIAVSGKDMRKDRIAYLRLVNWAEAEPLYPAFLTGRDLLHFYGACKGGDPKETEAVAEALGATAFLHRAVGTYSSGMAKKLSLVLAFAGRPSLILLDEPFITLDTDAVSALQTIITRAAATGVSFLISAHGEAPLPEGTPTLHIHHQKAELL
jgi:ABC-2 type transport system ATP-binding protein